MILTPKHVTGGGADLGAGAGLILAPGQHSSEETSPQRRAVGNTVSNLTGSGIKSQTFRTDKDDVIITSTHQFGP